MTDATKTNTNSKDELLSEYGNNKYPMAPSYNLYGAIMIKNEEKTIKKTLNTMMFLDKIYILDTGSEDKTLEKINEWKLESKNVIPVVIYEKKFPEPFDFRESRNYLLSKVEDDDKKDNWLFLIDSNDEVKIKRSIIRKLRYWVGKQIGFYVDIDWENERPVKKRTILPRIGIIKTHSYFKYGLTPVHEVLVNSQADITKPLGENNDVVCKIGVSYYQQRDDDDLKSLTRMQRDKRVLLKEYQDIILTKDFEKSPIYSRSLFYLGQTCTNLGNILTDEKESLKEFTDAVKFYELRTKVLTFKEEIFHSYYQMGAIGLLKFGKTLDETEQYMKKAFYHLPICEPLLFLACMYFDDFNTTHAAASLLLADMYCEYSQKISKPQNSNLHIAASDYDYRRYRLYVDICATIYNATKDVVYLEKAIANLKVALKRVDLSSDQKYLDKLIEEKSKIKLK